MWDEMARHHSITFPVIFLHQKLNPFVIISYVVVPFFPSSSVIPYYLDHVISHIMSACSFYSDKKCCWMYVSHVVGLEPSETWGSGRFTPRPFYPLGDIYRRADLCSGNTLKSYLEGSRFQCCLPWLTCTVLSVPSGKIRDNASNRLSFSNSFKIH
jgi:hypothetical protein